MSASRSHPERVLAAIAERRLALELGTLDLCFLVALYIRGRGRRAAIVKCYGRRFTLEETFP